MKMLDMMIDLETLGTDPGCAIQQIGYTLFNKETDEIYHSENLYIDKQSCFDKGLIADQETLNWWSKQSPEAKAEFEKPGKPLAEVLIYFATNFNWSQIATIWSHGATFDIPILGQAYKISQMKAPWGYRKARDTRTLFDLFKPDKIENPGKHIAVLDAIAQTKMVQSSFRKMKELCNDNSNV